MNADGDLIKQRECIMLIKMRSTTYIYSISPKDFVIVYTINPIVNCISTLVRNFERESLNVGAKYTVGNFISRQVTTSMTGYKYLQHIGFLKLPLTHEEIIPSAQEASPST